MASKWAPVLDKQRYAIAIHNFQDDGPNRLKLTVGESVHILEELDDWYYGSSTKNKTAKGVFPKCYVHIMESLPEKMGPTETTLKQPQLVQEITMVLREWGSIWKQLYITHSPNFKTIEHKMYELIRFRSQILSGTLPVDEMKEIKQLVTSTIDTGNKILGLDMVVRDEHGNLLNPDKTSTIELYWQHLQASERIQREITEPSRKPNKITSQKYSHTIFMAVRNFVCKISEDAELLFTLYDAKQQKSFTENFVVQWHQDNAASDINHFYYNLRVLFSDLGSRDLSREKVYLVCYVVRVGALDSNSKHKSISPSHCVRRPFGVAALDITLYLMGNLDSDEDKRHFLPFLACDKDNLDGTLKRLISIKELTQKDHKGQGVYVSFKLLDGDLKQVREENPHLVVGSVAVARKMGFPEIILPGDVRNDLYLTLVNGEFSKGSKSTDKNVEVTVQVCNEKGVPIQGVIVKGGGVPPQNEYKSMVYYHEDKPRWNESFKIAVPIEDFKQCHLKFTFKHRSSNETKDKSEKPYAMSFVPLMQPNGTTLPDTEHELRVYKIDHKKFDPTDISYLSLTSKNSGLIDNSNKSPTVVDGLTLCSKDSFIIYTNVCSTKLTQNENLLGLLNWTSHPDRLSDSLAALMKVDGEEIVKFLQDVLDALFNILMQNSDSDLYDNMVFECLLHIIGLVSDRKYQHFQPVLDLYIRESFCATLAYNKLMVVLQYLINDIDLADGSDKNLLLKTMKSIQYVMKFIIRSRILFSNLNAGKGQQQFEISLKQLLDSLVEIMRLNTDSVLLVQAACLKFLPSTIPDVLTAFSASDLSDFFKQLINKVPSGRLTKQKMMTISDLVHSPLFLDPSPRAILLPTITSKVKELLEARDEARSSIEFRNKTKSVAKIAKVLGEIGYKTATCDSVKDLHEELELCVKILSDIMNLLFKLESVSTANDIREIMLSILRTVIQTSIALDRETPMVGNLVAIMLSVFRQMSADHFDIYIKHFVTRIDMLDFLMEILLVFKDLVSRPVYPRDWCEMIMLQNSIILKSLRYFSHTIRDYFSVNFEHQAWNNFFHCAVAFLTQPYLQLETFSANKRWRIISRYKDMRRETGFEIRSMWFNLGQNKVQFVPGLVGSFLEMTLIPEAELRRATIPIFFDMMQCEFYSNRDGLLDSKKDSTHIKANFNEFENEMIAKLDNLVEGGRGDEQYKDLFYFIMMDLCKNHSTMRDLGTRFVKTVTRLMERLLEYRCIINDENKENRMSCTVNLLDFYSEINRKEMYIRYVNKLCDLHLECDNYTEAAYTLRLHSKLLSWSDSMLPPLLKSNKYPLCQTHRQLKDAIYRDMIIYFDKGKMWECALSICKELVQQYEDETYDYFQLSTLLRRMSQFYDNIMKQLRPEPEYFRVAYYGRGFPVFLQNKVFVYRGKEYERLSDFSSRTLNQLPNAELLNKLTPPGEEITESNNQYVQINKVDPVMDERKLRLSGKHISEQILRYYRVNNVQKFHFSRPFHRVDTALQDNTSSGSNSSGGDSSNVNEFASLWLERTVLVTSYPLPGILRWFPVTSTDTFHISPLRNAIETMEHANKSLRDLVLAHTTDPSMPINTLSMKLNGIVDAAVMGGVNNYEKAFFIPEYMNAHPEDAPLISKLKDLMACQIPLLDVGVRIHGQRAPSSLQPFHQRLEQCFNDMKIHIEQTYGKKTCDIKFDGHKLRRHNTGGKNSVNSENRHSLNSTSSADLNQSSQSKPSLISANSLSSSIALFTSPVLANSSPSKTDKYATLGKKEKKEKKMRRNRTTSKVSLERDSLSSINSQQSSSTQWYTSNIDTDAVSVASSNFSSPVYELRQELTSKRPLRSEVEKEKRLSRPLSGQFKINSISSVSLNNGSNRDSIATTDSTASEEDSVPPPLPVKLREADYCNLPDISDGSDTYKHVPAPKHSTPVKAKPPPPEPVEDSLVADSVPPPTPPPKRPYLKPPVS
nr:PREDICTED: dedicator of cytokinesis protein 1 isoform X2 [Bemisia tabaci]